MNALKQAIGAAAAIMVVGMAGGLFFRNIPSASAASAQPKSGQFDQVATVVSPRLSLKTTDRVTFKGVRFRLESADPESAMSYEDIQDGESYYHYIPAEHAALRLNIKQKPSSPLDELRAQTDQKLAGTQKSGEATMNGFDCDVYVRDLGNGAKVTLYQSRDPRFPYIVKTMMSIPAEGVTRSNSIDNVKLDIPVSEDTFTLPKGTKIVEQPAAPGGASASATDGAAPPSTTK